jgi:hypothetical protein
MPKLYATVTDPNPNPKFGGGVIAVYSKAEAQRAAQAVRENGRTPEIKRAK